MSILKTCVYRFDVGENGSGVDAMLEQLRRLADLGVQAAIGGVKDVWMVRPLEIMGNQVIPAAAAF